MLEFLLKKLNKPKTDEASVIINPVRSIQGGILFDENVQTANIKSVTVSDVNSVSILMRQEPNGTENIPAVKTGDKVYAGQIIGNPPENDGAFIHASVSGVVDKINDVQTVGGKITKNVVIKSDGCMIIDKTITPSQVKTKEEFAQAIKKSGLKSDFLKKSIDTLIVNALDCDFYSSVKCREIIENTNGIAVGIASIIKFCQIKRTIIVVSNKEKNAINILETKIKTNPDFLKNVHIMPVPPVYPSSNPLLAAYIAVGTDTENHFHMEICDVGFIGTYLKTGVPLITKRVTAAGSALRNPVNLVVPIGCSVGDVIFGASGLKRRAGKIIVGNVMTGQVISTMEKALTKSDDTIIAIDMSGIKPKQTGDCIRCGKCTDVCPAGIIRVKLLPFMLPFSKKNKNENCLFCNCCDYICPAGITKDGQT